MRFIVAFCAIAGLVTASTASPVLAWGHEITEISTIALFLTSYISMVFAGWVKRVRK